MFLYIAAHYTHTYIHTHSHTHTECIQFIYLDSSFFIIKVKRHFPLFQFSIYFTVVALPLQNCSVYRQFYLPHDSHYDVLTTLKTGYS